MPVVCDCSQHTGLINYRIGTMPVVAKIKCVDWGNSPIRGGVPCVISHMAMECVAYNVYVRL